MPDPGCAKRDAGSRVAPISANILKPRRMPCISELIWSVYAASPAMPQSARVRRVGSSAIAAPSPEGAPALRGCQSPRTHRPVAIGHPASKAIASLGRTSNRRSGRGSVLQRLTRVGLAVLFPSGSVLICRLVSTEAPLMLFVGPTAFFQGCSYGQSWRPRRKKNVQPAVFAVQVTEPRRTTTRRAARGPVRCAWRGAPGRRPQRVRLRLGCLLYTSDAADE